MNGKHPIRFPFLPWFHYTKASTFFKRIWASPITFWGVRLDKGRGQNRDHRVTFTAIGVRPLAAGVKTATEGSDSWPLWLSVTAAPALHWHGSKIKQGISATPNMPKSLVFSGFSYILFIPFVSIKRFTFLCKWCLWYNRILPLNILIFILFDFFFQVEDSTYIK